MKKVLICALCMVCVSFVALARGEYDVKQTKPCQDGLLCDLNGELITGVVKEYDKDEVRTVFRKSIRREKLWNYFKYLDGRKIAVEKLASKFAVTERTIQNDIKFLIDGGYIERKPNKTTKGKQRNEDQSKRNDVWTL